MSSLDLDKRVLSSAQPFLEWIDPAQPDREDPLTALKDDLAIFSRRLQEAEVLFAKHVYNNPNLSDLDVRQHRWVLHFLLYRAEDLAIKFLVAQRPSETVPYVEFLDDQTKRLQKILQDWHGDTAQADEIPESFEQAMRDVEMGRISSMEADMFDDDGTSEP